MSTLLLSALLRRFELLSQKLSMLFQISTSIFVLTFVRTRAVRSSAEGSNQGD